MSVDPNRARTRFPPGLAGCIGILLTAVLTAALNLPALLVLTGVWLLWAGFRGNRDLYWTYLKRLQTLRWFLLALALLHGAGALLAPEAARISLLLDGTRQVLILLLLLLAVTLVLEPLTINQRIVAFTRLLRPLAVLGVDPERVSRMLALALTEAFSLRENLRAGVDEVEHHAALSRTERLIDIVARRCLAIEKQPLD